MSFGGVSGLQSVGNKACGGSQCLVGRAGDNEASAQRISRQLGISDVRAGLTPAEKVEAVKSLSSSNRQGGGIIMVRCPSPSLTHACLSLA